MGSKPERTTMLPGILSGLGNLTARLGVSPLFAKDGFPLLTSKHLMTVPNGLPPSIVCSLPLSSTTVTSWNCISSLGICRALLSLWLGSPG